MSYQHALTSNTSTCGFCGTGEPYGPCETVVMGKEMMEDMNSITVNPQDL